MIRLKAVLGGEGLYKIVPGFAASWLAIVLVSRATPDRGEHRARPART